MFGILKKNSFQNFIPNKKNVLLIETNGCHGEVISGYIKYFQELNYNVYILVTDTIKSENPFCRINDIKIFHTKYKRFGKLLKSEYINRYDHIFIMSSINYTGGTNIVREIFPDLKKHKSVFYVHHNTPYIPNYYSDLDKTHNITLGRFSNAIYINPHLFGEHTIPEKTQQTIFISVGGINPKRKNHTLLLDAIQKLHDKNYDFIVYVVGGGSLKHIPKDVKKHIKLLGHIDYDKMYNFVEKSHYFLPLLDDKNPDHERYIKTQVTGSAQLIYGFSKIPIIHNKFAEFYSFNNSNAIIYDDLWIGMERAILQSNDDYKKYINEIINTSSKIRTESLENLKDILHAE